MSHTIEDVVDRGMCIGCGVCSTATGGRISLQLSRTRLYEADLTGVSAPDRRLGSAVCPFSDDAPNESELGAPHGQNDDLWHEVVGSYSYVTAARVASEDYLLGSSSGGMTSWIAGELLRLHMVDRIIHVGAAQEPNVEKFEYRISDIDAVAENRKSMYYATSMREVLDLVRSTDQTFALIGVPCFIKATRLLMLQDPVLNHRLKFFIGLVCGHLKSQLFAESLAWQLGVPPASFKSIDFRVKNANRPVGDYDTEVTSTSGLRRKSWTMSLVGGNWGHGAFQPNACNFCDDIFAETADVVLGDAWLPQFQDEWRGTNVVVSRNVEINGLIRDGVARGELETMDLTVEEAALSQAGNVRHRRLGLAVRLADDRAAGLSVPRKRVTPDASVVGKRRRALIRQRRRMSELSFELYDEARSADDISRYTAGMQAQIARYHKIEYSLGRRIVRCIKAELSRVRRFVPRRG
jgi:coenzyme F420 hydrogenase subunit beta